MEEKCNAGRQASDGEGGKEADRRAMRRLLSEERKKEAETSPWGVRC